MANIGIQLECKIWKIFEQQRDLMIQKDQMYCISLYKYLTEELYDEINIHKTDGFVSNDLDAIIQLLGNEDRVEKYCTMLEIHIQKQILDETIKLVSCNIDGYDCFYLTFYVDLQKLYEEFLALEQQ